MKARALTVIVEPFLVPAVTLRVCVNGAFSSIFTRLEPMEKSARRTLTNLLPLRFCFFQVSVTLNVEPAFTQLLGTPKLILAPGTVAVVVLVFGLVVVVAGGLGAVAGAE